MSRVHDCKCPAQPICDEHQAMEWGADEPDVCEGHGHGLTRPERDARRAIARIMEPLTEDERAAVVRDFTGWDMTDEQAAFYEREPVRS